MLESSPNGFDVPVAIKTESFGPHGGHDGMLSDATLAIIAAQRAKKLSRRQLHRETRAARKAAPIDTGRDIGPGTETRVAKYQDLWEARVSIEPESLRDFLACNQYSSEYPPATGKGRASGNTTLHPSGSASVKRKKTADPGSNEKLDRNPDRRPKKTKLTEQPQAVLADKLSLTASTRLPGDVPKATPMQQPQTDISPVGYKLAPEPLWPTFMKPGIGASGPPSAHASNTTSTPQGQTGVTPVGYKLAPEPLWPTFMKPGIGSSGPSGDGPPTANVSQQSEKHKYGRVLNKTPLSNANAQRIKLVQISYEDMGGTERLCESYERASSGDGTGNEVSVLAIVKGESWNHRSIVVVSKFRPSIGNVVVELPGGLIKPGESAENAAIRETGFLGTVKKCSGLLAANPALSNSRIQLVVMEIDRAVPETYTRPDDYTETMIIPVHSASARLKQLEEAGYVIDARLMHMAECFNLVGSGFPGPVQPNVQEQRVDPFGFGARGPVLPNVQQQRPPGHRKVKVFGARGRLARRH
ncbi:hypothetical protein HK104_005569 [Borealophlyctis nickersoniae]|nr:hypothetical protein HK104_005569 [Borealophlyctis nickersoniae]